MRVFADPNSAAVEAHLLSNGRYHVTVTSADGTATSAPLSASTLRLAAACCSIR